MNVREALADFRECRWDGVGELPDALAPIIERALRAAYDQAVADTLQEEPTRHNDSGVTAGVAAMVEES